MKKFVLGSLILVLALSFIACDRDGGSADWTRGDYSRRLSFTSAMNNPILGFDYTAGDPYALWWSTKYNWDIEVVPMASDRWNELPRIWVNSRDMPDVLIFNYTQTTHADAVSWAEQGLVKRMPDNWRELWPNISAVFDTTGLGPRIEEMMGGVYYLPRARFYEYLPGEPLPGHQAMHMRRDWAEAVGFPIKEAYTINEIMDYARLIRQHDPGRIGVNLQPITNRPGQALEIFVRRNFANFDTFFRDASGRYVWGGADPRTLEGLYLYYEAFSTGLLNREFFTLRNNEEWEQIRVTGIAASAYGGGTSTGFQIDYWNTFQQNLGLDPDEVMMFPIILGNDGYYHERETINYWGAIMFSPTIDEELFYRYMDMLDYNASDEGYLFSVAGFEGEDWEWRDGVMVNLNPPGLALEGANGKYPSMGYLLGTIRLWDDFSFVNPNVLQQYLDLSWKIYTDKVIYGRPDTLIPTDWEIWMYDSPARRRASVDFSTDFADIIINARSRADVETLWRQWINTQMSIIQPVLDELNALPRR